MASFGWRDWFSLTWIELFSTFWICNPKSLRTVSPANLETWGLTRFKNLHIHTKYAGEREPWVLPKTMEDPVTSTGVSDTFLSMKTYLGFDVSLTPRSHHPPLAGTLLSLLWPTYFVVVGDVRIVSVHPQKSECMLEIVLSLKSFPDRSWLWLLESKTKGVISVCRDILSIFNAWKWFIDFIEHCLWWMQEAS